MRKIFGTSAIALLLASCGGPDAEGTFETEGGGEGNYSIDQDGEDIEVSISDDEGNRIEINSGGGVDADFPEGYSLYPGASIVTNMSTARNGGEGVFIVFNTSDAPEDVAGFYREQAEEAGITINNQAVINGAHVFSGEGEDDATFNISASPSDDGTIAQLIVSSGL